MENLVVAALFFAGTHLGVSSSALRPALVGRLGRAGLPRPLLPPIAARDHLAGLGLELGPQVQIWTPGAGLRHLTVALMPVAFLLVVAGLSGPNPTAVGQRPDPDAREPATGILRVTRHPFLWGVGLWAALHTLANGDLASLVFFGGFAALGVAGTFLIDAKRTRAGTQGWGVFLQRTSNVPFVASSSAASASRCARSASPARPWPWPSTSPCSGLTRTSSASARYPRK
jgi:uncharacterized membrane protein